MKADITRSTFRPAKRYSGVRQQQGRVQLDADWNEQVDIHNRLIETETIDLIGQSGGPIGGAGFQVLINGAQLRLSAGRYYVDGIQIENPTEISVTSQPDRPGFALPTANGTYMVYLHVFRRHLTALEDPSIREVALGGPDTATRTKTVWQVEFLPVAAGTGCLSTIPEWNALTAATSLRMAARAEPTVVADEPCVVPASAGYRALENRLYRVEIHDGGANPTFKWSRENGSVVTKWTAKAGNVLTVSSVGKDSTTGFKQGDWIELFDDRNELLFLPGTMVRLTKVEGLQLTIDPATATGSVAFADFSRNPRIRRWDSDGLIAVPNNANPIDLEDGVQVIWTKAAARTGDYWTIPARVVTGDIEWERDTTGNPVALLPEGVPHHYARIAVAAKAGAAVSLTDCRNLYPVLTDMVTLNYVAGDGQEAMPVTGSPNPVPLAQPLVVGVSNGEHPVAGATVVFAAVDPGVNGRLNGTDLTNAVRIVTTTTNSEGLATCAWELDPAHHSQQVSARLMNGLGQPVHLPVAFTANLSTADQVAYTPTCSDLVGANVKTVKEALDALCEIRSEGGCCEVTVGVGGDYPTIEAAIQDVNVKNKKMRVALCLIAQEADHEVPNGLALGLPGTHLSIRGSGHPTRVKVGERGLIFRSYASVAIRDVVITGSGFDELITAVGTQEVQIRGCDLSLAGRDANSAAIRCQGAVRLTVADCRILSSHFRTTPGFGNLTNFNPQLTELLLADDITFEANREAVAATLTAMTAAERKRLVTDAGLSSVADPDPAVVLDDEPPIVFGPRRRREDGTGVLVGRRVRFSRVGEVLSSRLTAASAASLLDDLRAVAQTSTPSVGIHVVNATTNTIIENCQILGFVQLYAGPLSKIVRDQYDGLATAARRGVFNLDPTNAAAWIRGNTMIRAFLGEEVGNRLTQGNPEPFDVFRELRFEDNTFLLGQNIAVGDWLYFDGNAFRDPRQDPSLGISSRTILTGNVGGSDALFFNGSPFQTPQGMRETNFIPISG